MKDWRLATDRRGSSRGARIGGGVGLAAASVLIALGSVTLDSEARIKSERPQNGAHQSPALTRLWLFVPGSKKTRCARNTRFGFWYRRADPARLLIYFQPGGGCFDRKTCRPGSSWFDDRVDAADDPRHLGGIFDERRVENPFRGWSAVFIPSCTGDVHTGSRIASYGEGITIRHFGWLNAREALARTYTAVPHPRTVFVTGSSAGSVGSAFHLPSIIQAYPRARLSQVGDSLAFVFHSPLRLAEYGSLTHLPAALRRFPDLQPGRFTMASLLARLVKQYPSVRIARFNYRGDAVQQAFYEAVGGDPAEFSAALAAAEGEIHTRAPAYRSYLACGNSHVVLSTPNFYALTTKQTRLRDWVDGLVRGQDVPSVAC